MIRIAITQAAFDAIAKTLPLGSVAYEPAVDEGDLRYIWLEPRWLDRLNSYRGPSESYSDVTSRLAAEGVTHCMPQSRARLDRALDHEILAYVRHGLIAGAL